MGSWKHFVIFGIQRSLLLHGPKICWGCEATLNVVFLIWKIYITLKRRKTLFKKKKKLLWVADFPAAPGHAGRLNDTSELSHRSKMLPFMLALSVTWFGCCGVGVGAIENSVASEKRSRGHGSGYNLEHHLVRYMANILRSVGRAAQDPARYPLPLEMPAGQGEQCFQGFVQSVIPLSGATWYKCFRKNWCWSWTELQGPSRQGKPMVFSMRAMQSDGNQVLDMLLTNSAPFPWEHESYLTALSLRFLFHKMKK